MEETQKDYEPNIRLKTLEFVLFMEHVAYKSGGLLYRFRDRGEYLELAEKEPCVIVGRCADYILRDRADCLRAFIYADRKFRADRIVSVYRDVSQDPPEKRLRDKDKRRSAFYSYHTDMTWGDPHNYHICLDSGTLGFERCRDILCALY